MIPTKLPLLLCVPVVLSRHPATTTASNPPTNSYNMPPRPPLTTLAIHAWKEHGKPRPLSNEQTSCDSARRRISRSISQEVHPVSVPLPDDLPPRSLSRSSTFEENLSAHAAPVHHPAQVAAATSTAAFLASSISQEDLLEKPPVCQVRCTPPHSHHAIESDHSFVSSARSLLSPPAVSLLARGEDGHLSITCAAKPPVVKGWAAREPVAVKRERSCKVRATSKPGVTGESLLSGCLMKESASFDAGLSAVAASGVVQSAVVSGI